MKAKLLSTLIAGFSVLATPLSMANTYQAEIEGTYGEVNLDNSSADISIFNLTGTYYFAPVDTANRPLAESAFLQKSSYAYVNGAYSEYKENDSGFDSSEKGHLYHRELGANFYIPNSIFFLGAGISESKFKTVWKENGASVRASADWESQWYVNAGITPIDGLLVWSTFYENVDLSDAWNINAKYVMPIGNAGQWLNLEASFEDSDIDESKTLMLAADYYIDRHLSIGGGLTHYDLNHGNENEYFIRANQFFTDKFSVNLSYADGDYENLWTLGAALRF